MAFVPNITSSPPFTVEQQAGDADPNSFRITKSNGNNWYTLLLHSKPITTKLTFQFQFFNVPQNNIYVGLIYGITIPNHWHEVTNTWLGDINNRGQSTFTGISVDPLYSSPYPFPVYSNNIPHRLSSSIGQPLASGDIIRFSFDPNDGLVWISTNRDNYVGKHLFASGLIGKIVFPAISLHYDGNSVAFTTIVADK